MSRFEQTRCLVHLRAAKPSTNGAPAVLRRIPELRARPWWRPREWRLLLGALVLGVALGYGTSAARAHHAQPDVLGAVYAAAQRHGVDAEPLVALVRCESQGDAHAEGDKRWRAGRFVPTSRGAVQLSDLPTGLAAHFWSLGYDDRDDPEQAADYLARVAAGEFLPGRPNAPPLHPTGIVSLARWTCGRLLGLS